MSSQKMSVDYYLVAVFEKSAIILKHVGFLKIAKKELLKLFERMQ